MIGLDEIYSKEEKDWNGKKWKNYRITILKLWIGILGEERHMNLIDFIKEYMNRKNAFTKVVLEFFWIDEGIDEEYCFEGTPSEFVARYTQDYDCIEGLDIFDVRELEITNEGLRSQIYIKISRIEK